MEKHDNLLFEASSVDVEEIVDDSKKYCYKREPYYEYAVNFWSELNYAFGTTKPWPDYVPIVFADPSKDKRSVKSHGFTQTHINERTKKASIFPVVFLDKNRADSEIQQTIRHELIHYYLGLNYINHHDNSALFWLVCDLFDAEAYEQMNKEKQSLYDAAKQYLLQAYNLLKSEHKKNAPITLSLMLSNIDSAENEDAPNIGQLESTLRLLLKMIQLTK